MSATIDDKKLDGAGLATLWGIIKQYIVDNPSIPKATASTLGCIMVGTTLGVNNSGVLNLASGVVTAGTYKSVTVDTYGRVTAGTNPNTLAGYGITDAKIVDGSIILGENSITPITSLSGYATQTWVQQQGYLTEETYKGTVTQVKVGTTAYDPTSGVVSLPAYPTTLPASDVYSWAKAASKPSYTASEVGAATSGHTHTTSLASDSGTSTITLASAGKYKLTAGGTSVIFTMPTIPTVSYPVTSVNSKTGAVTLTASDVGAATSGHTHTTSIATSSGTNQLTLAFGTKYVLTAGGTSYIFTMPSNPNTNTTYKFTIGSTTNGDATNGVDLGTLKSETAAASGTTLSLVTTGEKATWNAKSNLTIGTTATTAAAGNHTHTLSIATSSGTNALTLAANTKYVLTAGGSTFIFTTPTDTNTWRPLGTGATDACAGNDSRLSDSRPASDVYSWAKAASKPSYTASEVGAATSNHTHGLSIATDSGTNQVTLAHGTKYKLTAGGSTLIFTMPSDNNNTYPKAVKNITRSGTTFTATCYDDTTFTFDQQDNNTWKAANTSQEGYAPKLALASTATIATQSTEYVLTYISGSETAPVWRKLPANAFKNDNTNTWRNVYTGGTSRVGTGTGTKAINFVAGSNVSITYEAAGTSSGQSGNANYFNIKIAATDTTYSVATQSANGLMSAADKTKLDGISLGSLMGSTTIGDTVQPIYWNGSAFKVISYTIAKSVPSDAKFTDTTYTFTNKGATLAWSTTSTIATVGGVDIKVTMPANPNTNTTYTIATGDSNGQIKVTPSSGSAYNVSVKGLGSNAYSSTSYLPLTGGTLTGSLTLSNANLSIECTTTADASVYVNNTKGTGKAVYLLASTNRGVYMQDKGWIISSDGSYTYVGVGDLIPSNSIVPTSDGSKNIGSTSKYWLNVYQNNSCVWNHVNVGYQIGHQTADRAEISVISRTDLPCDLMLGSNSAKKWSISCRNSSDSYYFGFYNYTTAAWAAYFLGSDFVCNGSVSGKSFINTSDIRKKNVVKEKVLLGLTEIANAPLFDFTWKDAEADKDVHIGTSAQYWKNVIPEVISVAKDEMCTLCMDYSATALASVISVAKETLTLKEKVALLETRVESLEKKVREYESN